MAKMGLLFIALFCAVQLSMAGRIVREADTTESSINVDKVAADIKDKFSAAGESIRGLFTQENFDKAVAGLKDAGEKFSDSAAKFGQSASETIKSAVDSIKEKANEQPAN